MDTLHIWDKKSTLKVRKNDLYQTPMVATEALLRLGLVPGCVWEPACGPGAIVKVLRHNNYYVFATDLVEYGCPNSRSRVDFLMEREAPPGYQCIVTNPPFKLAEEFVAHALKLCPKVFMFLRFNFLEGTGRTDILEDGSLARVYVFRNRLPMMHREGYEGKKALTSFSAFAWFYWDRDHKGPTQLHRISWTPQETPSTS